MSRHEDSYLPDRNDEPVIEGHMLNLFNGTLLIPPPLAQKSLASAVSFFPIQWGVHIGKEKAYLPFIQRFDLTEGKWNG